MLLTWTLRPALTLTRHRGLATVTCRLRAAPAALLCVWCANLCVCVSSLFVSAVPLELILKWMGLVAGLDAQQFPDKAAQLSRNSHDRLVALESPRQQTRVTTV